VPAAVARETPHALRIENGMPVYMVFISFGVYGFLRHLKSLNRKAILFGFLSAAYIFNVAYYLHAYYIHYPIEYSREWQYGYKQAIDFIQHSKEKYQTTYITESIGRPYMYVLFYEKFDPQKFRHSAKTSFDDAGFYHVFSFDSYVFVREDIKKFTPNSLYVLDPYEVPSNAKILKTIKLLNGDPVLVIFTV
jgi:hypothetical protein